MCSNTFKALFDTIDKSLFPFNTYHSAHRKDNDFELLEEHSQLCGEYFLHLVDKLGLEPIFDDFIDGLFGEKNKISVKQILLYMVYYHDIGKLNPNFQQVKVHNKKKSANSKHSFFSDRVLSSYLLDKYPDLEGPVYLAVNIVSKHHTRLGDFSTKNYAESLDEREIIEEIIQEVGINEITISKQSKDDFFWEEYNWQKMFLFVKLSYSLLVLSDSYSTLHYSQSLDSMYELNVISKDIHEKMAKSYSMISYNRNIDAISPVNIESCNDINEIRKEILVECSVNIERLLQEEHKIFMMTVPTGGGKTNISMNLALKILKYDETIRRIFYVFPFINIIEQNYKVIERSLFDESFFSERVGIISDIYSRSYVDKFNENEDTNISYFKKMKVIQDDNFLNNCVNVITNVNFFNCFIKTHGNNRYKIASLCNSIVIIDEIQTLSDRNIRTFYNFIKETSESLNIYYIIMSATLPDINYFIDNSNAVQLIDDAQKYYNHPVFKRNEVIFRKDINDIDGIKNLLIEEIEKNYVTGPVKILITLNLVATSARIYEELKYDEYFDDFSFYLLNSTTSNLRRRKMIEEIKDKNNDERIIIVSTQSIEAGVDIDCDFGIRDYSILDSIEQVSGRINRECNNNKSKISKLFIIKYKENRIADSKRIYGNQKRYTILQDNSSINEEEIIALKRFDTYYSTLSNEVKKIANDSLSSVNREIANLHYQSLSSELDVIDTKVEKIDIFIFDLISLDDLSESDIGNIKSLISDSDIQKFTANRSIISDGMIITENVYWAWKDIVTTTNKFENIYVIRKITSLLNQFIISINNIKSDYGSLRDYLETEGFIEVDDKFDIIVSTPKFSEFYSFDNGLNVLEIKEAMKKSSCGVII
ncbi:CRISPR-associated helicase Cas3' [Methanolobus vulcani]|uniref:CRISPR-associated helicase Cas3 n=1 Tax=Methanolobus vulcani TaxID=38026 RepID=A0A7Z8KMR5_9EURY|nr:CRISPR-associated helicase Cas3' [Methanolobus vulcani]TQD24011.1 CRISPR-associated helicase Cas3' [Methanolobus vulcani]